MGRTKKIAVFLSILLAVFLVVTNPYLSKLPGISHLVGWWVQEPSAQVGININEVKEICKLATVEYYADVPIKYDESKKIWNDSIVIPGTNTRFLVLAKGKVGAGIDIEKIGAEDISYDGQVIEIKLPDAEIIYAEIFNHEVWDNSSGIFVDKLTAEEYIPLEQQAKEKLIDTARENDIMEEAEDRAKVLLEAFLKSKLGVEEVVFS